MPRKTKKQKIASLKRTPIPQKYSTVVIDSKQTPLKAQPIQKPKIVRESTILMVKKDLIKTIILSSILVVLEIALFYVTLKGILPIPKF